MRPARVPHRALRGFSVLELMLVLALTATVVASLMPLLGRSVCLRDEAHARQRAEAEHRRNVAALVKVLRDVELASLAGFDAHGASTQPSFVRIRGADRVDLLFEGAETLRWEATPRRVDGVERPGAVYLLRDGSRTLIADRVPAGGFRVHRDGARLTLELTTYYVTDATRVIERRSRRAVAVRN